jgi:hypothetical protein
VGRPSLHRPGLPKGEAYTDMQHGINTVYGNAYFTIVAALDYDANCGLRGIKGICPANIR